MLAPLKAEQKLLTIEAVSVLHMKSDAVGRLLGRLARRARREPSKPLAAQLMERMKVVHEPTKKVTDGR